MFSKKKIMYFLLFLIIVASADIWIFSSIKDSYTKIINDNILETGKIIFSSVSDKTEDIDSWISNVENNYENIRIIYIKGLPQFEETTEFYKNKEFYEFYKSKLSDPIFEKGLESAVYSEYFLTDNMYSLDNSQYKIVFAPILTSEYDIVGIGIMFFNMEGYLKFYRLLNIFAVSIIVAFVLVYGIILFSRDPVMNFIILGLFVIVGIFTAYPLFEAVRLTFIKNGEFSMEIWKKILTTDQYLKAFWGSIKLGISTATLSTLIGFLFAFTLTRTSIKGKKFFSTMATLPVISPPFSLTLSILLLFGNNGLITKKYCICKILVCTA